MPDDNSFPSPATGHPVALADGSRHEGTVFLAAVVDHPRFQVGDYTYASAHTAPSDWPIKDILKHEKLIAEADVTVLARVVDKA